jgi:hypothetical protein
VSVDGILPSETSEAYTEDHFAGSVVAHGGPAVHQSFVVGVGVVDCARRGAASERRRAGVVNFILRFFRNAVFLKLLKSDSVPQYVI